MEHVTSSASISRRTLLGGAGVAAAAGAIAAARPARASEAAGQQSWMPGEWAGEADIVVVGAGGAGLSAGITALHEELGSVLVLEYAPDGESGGNTRVSGQTLFIPDTPEDAIVYQTSLNGPYEVADELMQAWATNLCENLTWLEEVGIHLEEGLACNPEFPELEGSEHCHTYQPEGVTGQARLWELMCTVAEELGVPVEYDVHVTELVFDPQTKEVFGVRTEDGRCYKALKGVVLACGGWENNPQLMDTYYTNGYPDMAPAGTPYNVGDGLVMAQSIGADLWHMNNYSLADLGVRTNPDSPCVSFPAWSTKDYIYVGPNAKRYIYEETSSLNKHGKTLRDGVYVSEHVPMPQHVIFGSAAFEQGPLFPNYPYLWTDLILDKPGDTNQAFVDAGLIYKADTIAELAEQIGLDPATLEGTVTQYNEYCEQGVDPDFHRGEDYYGNFSGMVGGAGASSTEESVVIPSFELQKIEPPYYAMRQYISILNTQGGPKRDVNGQVLDTKGNPIPRLFAAGELGCIYPYMYNGGGNVSEAVSSGRLAARSIAALDAWE